MTAPSHVDAQTESAPNASPAAPIVARGPFFIGAEGHLSLLTDAPRRSLVNITVGFAARGGYRWGAFGVLLHVERNYWLATEYRTELVAGSLNVGVGGEYWYLDGFARTSVLIGPSVLMFDTPLHDAGAVGIYFDLRPIGLRYRLHERIALMFDPLSVAYVEPTLGSEAIIRQVEYRTLLSLEVEI